MTNRTVRGGRRGRIIPGQRNPSAPLLVTDRDQLAELATVWQGAGHVARSAATVALVAPVIEGPDRRPFEEVVHRGRW
jgi:hypothetical protein